MSARKIVHLTNAALNRMAWLPSSRCPHPRELLTPQPVPATNGALADLLARWTARDVVWEAGLPVELSLSGRAFLAGGDELLRAAAIRSVRLVAIAPLMAELAACPHIARLARLDLSGNWIGDSGMSLFAESPHIGGLRELVVRGNGLSEAVLTRLRERIGTITE